MKITKKRGCVCDACQPFHWSDLVFLFSDLVWGRCVGASQDTAAFAYCESLSYTFNNKWVINLGDGDSWFSV